MDLINFFVFVAFVVSFFFSLLIHFRTSKTQAHLSLEVMAFAFTGWCFTTLFFREASYFSVTGWAKLWFVFLSIIPSFFLLFSLYFPKDKIQKWIVGLVLAVNFSVIALTLYQGNVVNSVDTTSLGEHLIYFGWAFYYIYILYFFFFFSLAFYVCVKKYIHQNYQHDLQLFYIAVSGAVVVIPTIITNIWMPAMGNFSLNWVGQVLGVLWIASITYALIAPRLMDSRLFASRVIIYTLLLVLLAGFYAVGTCIALFAFGLEFSRIVQFVVSLLLALVITVVFQPLKRLLENAADRLFYKNHYNPREMLSSLGKIATSTLSLSILADLLLEEVQQQIKPTFSSLVVFKNDKIYLSRVRRSEEEYSLEFEYSKLMVLVDNMTEKLHEKVLVYHALSSEARERKVMREYGIELFLPLTVKNSIVGVLMLGSKYSGDIYTDNDIEMFRILGSEIAVAVNNSLSYEEIVHFNETLEQKVDHATGNLRSANKRLKELDRVKDEFMSIASHEMRTPLTVIRSYLWMLLQDKAGRMNKKQRMYMERAFTSADRLIDLVNDMLNVARIEARRMTLIKVKHDIVQSVRNVVTGMTLRAEELSIDLKFVQHKKSIPETEVDSEKIEQVIINLIGNSLKFTPAGGKITVTVDFNHENKEIVVCVADTGIGLSHEDIPKLFHKFANPGGEYKTHTNMQSTGLGLYLSKSIIKMHGGRMWAESDGEGKGSEFYFTIPVD